MKRFLKYYILLNMLVNRIMKGLIVRMSTQKGYMKNRDNKCRI